ncbi:MAG: hypothetical protein NTW91_10295 [Verrucomicrobia bacterium]|nr:hypothetical protein [Verrucomicrobiota bacterium]
MNLSRIPSLSLFLLGSVLAFAPTLQAGASNKNGNPFGNGTFFQTTGTFSAVVRGENLSGTMLFSTGVSTNAVSTNSSGTTTISYLGSSDGSTRAGIYLGNAVGMWDPSSGAISGQIWGGQMLSGTNSTTVWPEIYNNSNNPLSPSSPLNPNYDPTAPSFPVAINTESNVVIPPVADTNGGFVPGTNYVVTNTIYVMPYGSNSFNDTAYMSGNFSGSTQNKYPNQTFTAQGTLIQQQLYPQQADTGEGTTPVQMNADLQIPITVQGIRVSESYSSFNKVSNSVPYSQTTYSITNFATF